MGARGWVIFLGERNSSLYPILSPCRMKLRTSNGSRAVTFGREI